MSEPEIELGALAPQLPEVFELREILSAGSRSFVLRAKFRDGCSQEQRMEFLRDAGCASENLAREVPACVVLKIPRDRFPAVSLRNSFRKEFQLLNSFNSDFIIRTLGYLEEFNCLILEDFDAFLLLCTHNPYAIATPRPHLHHT